MTLAIKCEHGKRKYLGRAREGACEECAQTYTCEHGKRRHRCGECGAPERSVQRRADHLKDPRKEMLQSARARAHNLGVPYDLSLSDIRIPEKCPVLGIPLFVGAGKPSGNSPTVDRRIPELGYVRGNVSVISHRANRIKGAATSDELMRVALWAQARPPYIPSFENFVPGTTQVVYSGPYFDGREISAAVGALLHGKWLTSGEYVARFQGRFAQRFHTKHALMVNSGSSANLVMIAALKRRFGWRDGDEIVVSPVGFPTTIAPIVQNGLKPVFADIELSTLNFDLDKVEQAITFKTKAIFTSPVLGNPPDMNRLRQIVYRRDVLLVGDHCDSLGTKWEGQLLNELYYSWSTSGYPAHHFTTGECGLVCSDDKGLMDIARSFASWGRSCYCVGAANLLPCGTCGKRFSDWLEDGSVSDHKYIFDNLGYNLKPGLDLQGAIGLVQLEKFDEIEAKRRANKLSISRFFEGSVDVRVAATEEGADPSWFGVPLICRNQAVKENLVAHFEANKIQTRPYFAGNILRHPGFRHLGNAADFPNADQALKQVFFLGVAPFYTPEVLEYIGKVFRSWSA